MSLRFIYGRAGSGKTHFCLNEIKTRVMAGAKHPLVLLVPEQFTFQAERDLITVLGTGGILKTEVLSFRRVAFRIFNEVGGITYPHIHSAGKCMILYRILDKMHGSLKVFAKTADRQGFVNTLAELFTEFKRYNINVEVLKSSYESLNQDNSQNSSLKDKIIEIGKIYEEFENIISERYRDPDDDLTIASEKLAITSIYDGAEIWIDGFAGFTPQEYKIIGKLLEKADRVNISLCTDCLASEADFAVTDVFSSVKATCYKFLKIAKELNINVEKHVALIENSSDGLLPRYKKSAELAHLERNFYTYPYKIYKQKTQDICLFSSVNIFTEIEAAARGIVSLCRDRSMRYRDIAVVIRNLAEYEKLIEVIFTEYRIPYFIDRKINITNHPVVRMILSMLDIFIDNWSYESVFRYLKTGMTDIERSSIDKIENYVLACGIRGSKWTNGQDWSMSPNLIPDEKDDDINDEKLAEINKIRNDISLPLLEFRNKTKGRKKASEICEALYDFLCTINVRERIENIINQFKQRGEQNLANEYSQVWNIVMEVFDQTVEVMGNEEFTIEKFSKILKIGFGEYKIGLIPASLDQVLVGSVERSRSHEIKALYILGANDGVFPSSAFDEGVLSDADRAALNNAGIELASDTRKKVFDEQYLVYRALTISGRYLRISWPIADNEGKAMRHSIIISRLRKLFPSISESSNIIKPESGMGEIDLITGRTPAFRQMICALRQKADGVEIADLWRDVYQWFGAQEEWKQKCLLLREAFKYKNIIQTVGKDKIESLYGNTINTTVSRLEKYSACPFAFYIQYGLKARERKVYQLSPPDVGTFMHTVIERFSRQTVGQNVSWREMDREWCTARVSEIVDDMLENMQGSGIAGSKRYTALTVRLKRVISRAVWLIAEHIRRSSFEPIGYEVDFGGEDGKLEPITIDLDSGIKVNLKGRIDRVDALKTEEGTYLRIIDYKSGYKDFKLSDVYHGLQIQLITYLDALWKNFEMDIGQPIYPGGILYFKIDDPIIKKIGSAAEDEIEQAIMKQLKMKGLLLADVKLIKAMDNTIEGASIIIPARINKGDILGKSSAASLNQFTLLRKYVKKLLRELCEEITKGNFSIKPYKKKGTASCKYCSFSAICQFDSVLKENSYRQLYDFEDDEVWRLMEKEDSDGRNKMDK